MKNDGVDIGDDLIRELINTLTIFIFFKCFYFKNLCFLLYEFMFDQVWIVNHEDFDDVKKNLLDKGGECESCKL